MLHRTDAEVRDSATPQSAATVAVIHPAKAEGSGQKSRGDTERRLPVEIGMRRLHPILALILAAACVGFQPPQRPAWRSRVAVRSRILACSPPAPPPDGAGGDGDGQAPQTPDDLPAKETDATSQALNDELRRREESESCEGLSEFNAGLYEHLRRRPEFANRELYNELSSRVNVSEQVFNSWRDQVNATTRLEPEAGQTPGEVVSLVLRALQDCDYPRDGHGIEVLQAFSSDVCIASSSKISSEMLYRYVKGSKFRILLDWVNVLYSKKLETSLEGRRAYQELRLKSGTSGKWESVNFMLGNSAEDGLWRIEHIRVKGALSEPGGDFEDDEEEKTEEEEATEQGDESPPAAE